VTTVASTNAPVGAADVTPGVCLDIAVAEPRRSDCTRTTASAPSQHDFGQRKRLVPTSQTSRTAPLGSPLHSVRVPMHLIRVPRG